MFGVGEEKEGLDGGILQSVDSSDGLLIFEVGSGADATNNGLRTELMAEVYGHSFIGCHLNRGTVGEPFLDNFHSLLDREHTAKGAIRSTSVALSFLAVDTHSHHHFVEERQHTTQDGLVTSGERIERPGEES